MKKGLRRALRGSQIVEAAITMPLLATMLLVCLGGANLFRTTMLAESASAEAARYASLHPDASDGDIEQRARESVGAEGAAVTVTRTALPDQDYTMRVLDAQGNDRSAEARTTSEAVSVKVDLGVHVLGLTDYTASSTHTGIQSREAQQR